MLAARDTYRVTLDTEGMHRDIVRLYITTLAQILAPIAPHTCDHMYVTLLEAGPCVLNAGWPQLDAPDFALQRAAAFVEDLISKVRAAVQKKEAVPKKHPGTDLDRELKRT